MGILELLGAISLGGVVGVSTAAFLGKALVANLFAKELATHTANLNATVNEAKAHVEAHLRQRVELTLADASTERQYRAEAKRRLYQAVGPLRFQLMVAAAEWTNRVARFGVKDSSTYKMHVGGHFFRSTAYRLLRLLTVAELIERQIAYADFGVDPDMRVLLRFKRQLGQCLSGAEVSLGHSQENWQVQDQHVFSDTLSNVATAMVVVDSSLNAERVIRFDEFQAILDDEGRCATLQPIPRLLTDFSCTSKPILWMRMLALTQLCTALLEKQGQELGIELQVIDLKKLLLQTDDDSIRARQADYLAALEAFRSALIQPIGTSQAAPLDSGRAAAAERIESTEIRSD